MATQASPVVVGTDGSWQSKVAVARAAREAALRGAPLVLLAVAREAGFEVGLAELRRAEAESVAHAWAVAKRAKDVVDDAQPGLVARIEVVASVHAPELEALAARSCLLVLGGRGRGGQLTFSLGSISAEVARRFSTPILITPARRGEVAERSRHAVADRPSEVLVGVNGGAGDEAVLRFGAQEARLRRCSLGIIRAMDRPSWLRLDEAVDETWKAVNAVQECAAVPCHVDVMWSPPVEALAGHCTPEDLLVVGTRGEGRLAGLIGGSVARGVLDQVPCDVVVIPPQAALAAPGQPTRSAHA